nr:MAG TPA: hypothetical protein [Caudoviricetes sp.]
MTVPGSSPKRRNASERSGEQKNLGVFQWAICFF